MKVLRVIATGMVIYQDTCRACDLHFTARSERSVRESYAAHWERQHQRIDPAIEQTRDAA